MQMRAYTEADRQTMKDLTAATFESVSIDRNMEREFGLMNGTDWAWRKVRHIDADCDANPDGIFIAEDAGEMVGYITTRLDRDTGLGWIPNMAVAPSRQGQGIGRALLVHALDYFRREGMGHAKIETLDQNAVGGHLYPSLGFREVARQIHYAMKL